MGIFKKKTFDPTNKGRLTVNRKKKDRKSPDYTGIGNRDGIAFFIAGWKGEDRETGEEIINLKFTVIEKHQGAVPF